MHLPHVEVSFKTDDLSFFRRQVTEYTRYLDDVHDDVVPTPNPTLEHVEQLTKARACYSYNYVQGYIKDYLGLLRKLKVF